MRSLTLKDKFTLIAATVGMGAFVASRQTDGWILFASIMGAFAITSWVFTIFPPLQKTLDRALAEGEWPVANRLASFFSFLSALVFAAFSPWLARGLIGWFFEG